MLVLRNVLRLQAYLGKCQPGAKKYELSVNDVRMC